MRRCRPRAGPGARSGSARHRHGAGAGAEPDVDRPGDRGGQPCGGRRFRQRVPQLPSGRDHAAQARPAPAGRRPGRRRELKGPRRARHPRLHSPCSSRSTRPCRWDGDSGSRSNAYGGEIAVSIWNRNAVRVEADPGAKHRGRDRPQRDDRLGPDLRPPRAPVRRGPPRSPCPPGCRSTSRGCIPTSPWPATRAADHGGNGAGRCQRERRRWAGLAPLGRRAA